MYTLSGLFFGLLAKLQSTAAASDLCAAPLDFIRAESGETPFYTHYHQILLPVQALKNPPAEGLTLKSSPVDADSFNEIEFDKFINSSGLKKSNLVAHSHDVFVSGAQLEKIASGEKVEVRVISKAGNFVHNFIIQTPPSALAALKRKKLK